MFSFHNGNKFTGTQFDSTDHICMYVCIIFKIVSAFTHIHLNISYSGELGEGSGEHLPWVQFPGTHPVLVCYLLL